jgi:hypothetical protein
MLFGTRSKDRLHQDGEVINDLCFRNHTLPSVPNQDNYFPPMGYEGGFAILCLIVSTLAYSEVLDLSYARDNPALNFNQSNESMVTCRVNPREGWASASVQCNAEFNWNRDAIPVEKLESDAKHVCEAGSKGDYLNTPHRSCNHGKWNKEGGCDCHFGYAGSRCNSVDNFIVGIVSFIACLASGLYYWINIIENDTPLRNSYRTDR